MSAYQAVTVYDLDGNFLGYAIKQVGVDKLHNNNLWAEKDTPDLKEQLQRLNQAGDIRQFWPNVRDPEVQALINDENWEPLEKSPVEVTDEDNSVFIWIEEPTDESPGIMDTENSIIATKIVYAPAPAHASARIKKACEVVARRRAGA